MSMTLAQLMEINRQRELAAPPVLDTGVVVGTLSAQQTIPVNCNGNTEIAIVPVGLGLTAGNLVVLGAVNGKPIVLAQLTGTATAPTPPLGRPVVGVSTFTATDARTWVNGAWRADSAAITQGDSSGVPNTGAWFYGGGPAAALAGATITQARIRMRRRSGGAAGGQTVNVYPHSSDTRPATNIARVGVDGPATAGLSIGVATWITLPVAWGQRIVTTGGGLHIAGNPYLACDGLDADPQSGLLELTWNR